jgi:hypothetical protein
MIELEDAERLGRDALATGSTIEDVLLMWRAHGLSILQCMQCLAHVSGLPLGKAKEMVHCSSAWSDLRAEHDRVHDELEKISEI